MLCKADNVDDVISLLVAFKVVWVMFVSVLYRNGASRLHFFATEGEGIFGRKVTLPNIPKVAIFSEAPGAPYQIHARQTEVTEEEIKRVASIMDCSRFM